MDASARFFWGLVAVLLAAAVLFGVAAEQRRRQLSSGEAPSVAAPDAEPAEGAP